MGLLVLHDGNITGVDAGGGEYLGQYVSPSDEAPLIGDMTLSIKKSLALVTGVTMPDDTKLEFKLDLQGGFADGASVSRIETTTGPINLICKKIRGWLDA